MTSTHHRGSIRYLGSLRGRGHLAFGESPEFAAIRYEIDGFLDRARRTATGRIEGERTALARAYRAGGARLTLDGGLHELDLVLVDPEGGAATEVTVSGAFPL